jgi:hypothetical protein
VLQLLLRRVTGKIGWPAVNQRQARAKGGLELQMDKASRQCTDRPPGLGAAGGREGIEGGAPGGVWGPWLRRQRVGGQSERGMQPRPGP